MSGGQCDVCGGNVDVLYRRDGAVDHAGDTVCGDCFLIGWDWPEWPDNAPNWNGGQG